MTIPAPDCRDPKDPVCSYFELCRRQAVDAAAKAEREAAENYAVNEPQVDVDLPVAKAEHTLLPGDFWHRAVVLADEPGHYIPQDDQTRKDAPMFRGLLGYFPAALFEVAAHSLDSDRKHNPGSVDGPHWARQKSNDHEDTILRHLTDAGPRRTSLAWQLFERFKFWAPKGSSAKDARRYHLRCIAWRALALLQEDCEADGAQPGVSSVFPQSPGCASPSACHTQQKCLGGCGRS
jgi:hypothetical protein